MLMRHIILMNYDMKGVSEKHLNNMCNSPVCGTFGDYGEEVGHSKRQIDFAWVWRIRSKMKMGAALLTEK